MHPLLDKLNPQQREAVEAVDGPVLILAGAGSGKTRVITHRIAWLIQERGVAPDSILAVTFTNKASGEMAERVEKLIGHTTLAKPLVATFHSFCVRLLRRDIEALRINGEGLTKSFAIYDESDQQAVVKAAMRRMGLDDKQLTPRVVLSKISWAKNHMIDPQEYYLNSSDPTGERVAHIFESYRKELGKANALDFDDLLLEAVRLLKSSSEVRQRYNRRYRYLLIDEYQDTNRPQYELMKLLAGEEKNVCVVGDEDQSIYSWRGADIRNILEFEKDFPNVKTIRLEQNYRSTQIILEAAGAVVSRNTQRKGKSLWTSRQGGALIGYYEAPDGENEALFIADSIQKYLRKAGQEEENPRAAVLYRTNSQSRLIEEAMRRYGIKYTMVGGFSFYERAEIKDLLSYLKLVQNPDDSIALQRSINTPVRGIGKTTLETLERLALETGTSTWAAISRALREKLLPSRALIALDNFCRIIEDARALLAPNFDDKLSADLAEENITEENADISFD
ncbi:MAG: ATP-dependent helicase, partial [Acidobacteriaceae bacterium]